MFAKLLRTVAYILLVLISLAAIGAVVPAIPGISELGSMFMNALGPWVTILSLIGAVVVFVRWRNQRRPGILVIALLATAAAVGSFVMQAQQIAVARDAGASINLGEAILAGSQIDNSLHPTTIIYTKHEGTGVPLDIYRATTAPGRRAAPVFVYIHGGGWNAETLKQRQADFHWFAERGYLVISLEYSLSSETRHMWNVAQPQLGCALAWVNANAARFGGNPARVALWGESAGGNLALNVSYMANRGTLKPSCPGQLPHISATVAIYPVIDPARMYRLESKLVGVFARLMTVNYTGGTPDEVPDRYAAIATATHISAAAPPTLLIIPESDHLVKAQAAYDFTAKAQAAGVDVRLIRMPHAEHGFDLRSGSVGNQMVRQTMLAFLADHGLKP